VVRTEGREKSRRERKKEEESVRWLGGGKRREKKDDKGGMWHFVGDWKEMMKSPTANRVVTRGKDEIPFI
jgi:hypothetical protein